MSRRARTRTSSQAEPATAPLPREVVPFKARWLDEARERWAAADWRVLDQLDPQALESHPDRGALALISAAASLQGGDRRLARERAKRALAWGCERRTLAAVLLASARHALGRASVAAGRLERATHHFERTAFEAPLQSESRRVGRRHLDDVQTELATRRAAALRDRKAGVRSNAESMRAWITDLVSRCLAAVDLHDAVDGCLERLLAGADDRLRFLMELAERLRQRGDAMTALHFLNTARDLAGGASHPLRQALVQRLTAAGHAEVAMGLLVDDALAVIGGDAEGAAMQGKLRQAWNAALAGEQARKEHGHELLLSHLRLHLQSMQAAAGHRRLQLVEIGTTRENVPGQGSTRKLAEFCRDHGLDFVTVDMDPHNTRMAEQLFAEMQVPFEAVTMKGEDYLRARAAPVDLAFLDAYDFDHGKHSELRQSRYVKFLGARIDEEACHRMHLDCAQSLMRLLSPQGLVCIDDTWLDEQGHWTAKGTLAMPHLLDQGFVLIDARNRAALLARGEPASA